MIFPFTIKIIVRMLYFLKKNLFKILLRSYKILCKILQDYETFLSHNLVRSYIRILTKILVKILNKIFCLGDTYRHFFLYLKCYLIMRLTYFYRIVDCLPQYNTGYFIRQRLFQPILKLLVQFSLFKSVPIPSYVLPTRRPCSGTGYEEGQYPFVLYQWRS